jgi:hypothetical protein
MGSRNHRDVRDIGGKKIPDSNWWTFPNSPSPESENLNDFTYYFSEDSHPIFFIFDAVNYYDLDSKLPVTTGLKYKFYHDGEVIKEGDYGRDEYIQLFNIGEKDNAIQTITAEVYNDVGSKKISRRFFVDNKYNSYRKQKGYFWVWDDLILRPESRHGGLVCLQKSGATSGIQSSGVFDHRRAQLHFDCLNWKDIPEYYKDAWKIQVEIFAPGFGDNENQWGVINMKRDATGKKYRARKRIFSLRELHESKFMIWGDAKNPPTVELTKVGRMSSGRPTDNTKSGAYPIDIPTGKSMSKKHIKFNVFEDEITFKLNSDPSYPFNSYKEPTA